MKNTQGTFMKKEFVSLLSIMLILSIYGTPDSAQEKYDAFLFSFPFSGSHWLMYSITTITGKFWTRRTKAELAYHNFNLPVTEAPLLFHTHEVEQNRFKRPFHPEEDKIILLLRNYKEVFIRMVRPENVTSLLDSYEQHQNDEDKWPRNHTNKYFELLKIFDEIPNKNKCIVYYEDLIKDPAKIITEIVLFLNGSQEKLDEFLENLKLHQRKMIAFYEVSLSKGKDLFFHSKKVSTDTLIRFDNAIKKLHPHLFKKYLTRYEI